MKGTSWPVSTPPQSSPGTQVYSGSRNEISAQVKEVAGYKLVIPFLYSHGMLCWDGFQFCACWQCTATWVSCDIYRQLICGFPQFFLHRGYCTNSSKVQCDDPQVLVEYLLEIQSFFTCGKKEGDKAFIYSFFLAYFVCVGNLKVSFCLIS